MSATRRELTAVVLSFAVLSTALASMVPMQAGNPEPPKTTGFDTPITDPKTGTRNLLTVLLEYTDLSADVPASYIENQVFGPRPSMNDYFMETSYGNFNFANKGHFAWVTSWDDPGTTEDESTWAYWQNHTDDVWHSGVQRAHALISLDKAGYDFAPLDTNGDDEIQMDSELGCQVIFSRPDDHRGAANRYIPHTTLDGKELSGSCTGVSEDSPWVTLYAHELGHQTLWMPDYYGIKPQNIGYFHLMGFSGTGGWAGPVGPHHIDPYFKMKLGWHTPTVVTSDGFFNILDSETNSVSYILHDPAHGTDEYFMVENRWKGTSYDDTDSIIPAVVPPLPTAHAATDIPDEGLLIWHVDETRDWNGTSTGGYPKVNLTRRGLTDSTAAFNGDDADYYDFYDGSIPLNANWNGGGNSKIGVWCVSGAGATMRAWLDVPGPGILACSEIDSASAIPGNLGLFRVKLTNTGDVADTFSVNVVGLDSDLEAILPGNQAINSKSTRTVDVNIRPIRDCTTSPGIRTFKIRVESISDPSVWSEVDATLEVLPYGEPHLTMLSSYEETEPNATATYTLQIDNEGNAVDTYDFDFMGHDFGSLYRADPTVIHYSWMAFNPTHPSAPACGSTMTILSITVPWDWAGMEDALYEFTITVFSSITSDADWGTGRLLVQATPLSMMLWVKAEIEDLVSDVMNLLPPSDVRDGLYDKAVSAYYKIEQAFDRYLLGDDPPASNLFGTTQNKLKAFLHQLDAQEGKALTIAQADYFRTFVMQIIADIDMILASI